MVAPKLVIVVSFGLSKALMIYAPLAVSDCAPWIGYTLKELRQIFCDPCLLVSTRTAPFLAVLINPFYRLNEAVKKSTKPNAYRS